MSSPEKYQRPTKSEKTMTEEEKNALRGAVHDYKEYKMAVAAELEKRKAEETEESNIIDVSNEEIYGRGEKLTLEEAKKIKVGDKLFIKMGFSDIPKKIGWKEGVLMEVIEVLSEDGDQPLRFKVRQGDKEDTWAWSWFSKNEG